VTYSMSTRCSIGSIGIPPTLTSEIRITGCAAGLEPSDALVHPMCEVGCTVTVVQLRVGVVRLWAQPAVAAY
jgi:hypothetical protein